MIQLAMRLGISLLQTGKDFFNPAGFGGCAFVRHRLHLVSLAGK